jgi:polysaccharide biosynthesis protein PslH
MSFQRRKLRILIVSARLPKLLGKADSKTVYHLIKFLKDRGHEVSLVSYYDKHDTLADQEHIQQLCTRCIIIYLNNTLAKLRSLFAVFNKIPLQVAYYKSRQFDETIKMLVETEEFDVLYSHLVRTGHYLVGYDHPRILAMQISQTLNYKRMIANTSQFWVKVLYSLEYKLVKSYEPWILQKFERVLLISQADCDAIVGLQKEAAQRIFFNPHGIEVDYYLSYNGIQDREDTIVMTADFGTPTNIDAVLYFYRTIFPIVKRSRSDAKLLLVGRNPSNEVLKLAKDPDVTVTGGVKDLRPYLSTASVAIDPLRIGAGMQNKILVCMAMGIPMVATSIANEGIQATHGENILIADSPEDFANCVLKLLHEREFAQSLSNRAQHFVQNYWSWEYHFLKLESDIYGLCSDPKSFPVQYMQGSVESVP